jgi:hypothetical protein
MKNFPICNVRQVEGAVCPILDIHGFTTGRLAAGYISQSIGSWTIRATATPSRLAPCVRQPCDNRCRFSLSLYLDKTRLIELDRFAADPRARRGLGKPETFNVPGFTFICERNSQGKFFILRENRRDRMRAKLKAIKEDCDGACTSQSPQARAWLQQVVRGFFAYHAVPTNWEALQAFRHPSSNLTGEGLAQLFFWKVAWHVSQASRKSVAVFLKSVSFSAWFNMNADLAAAWASL